MFFQVYCFKNVGVAGYVEAFEMVQLEKQASYMGYLFRNRCTSMYSEGNNNIMPFCKEGLTAYRFGTAMSYSIRIYYLFQFFLNYETQKEC